ncbi:metallophosphoesterase [bacterium]|nr:metallophosphoesterase [bacterium]
MSTSLLLTGLLASYVAAETYSITWERLVIKDPQLPESFHNLKVIFVSDIHHGRMASQKRLQVMVDKINRAHPDLVLFGGDYLQTYRDNHQSMKRAYDQLVCALQGLKPCEFGIYAVMGNHDYVFSPDYNRQQLAQAGIEMLINQGVNLKRGQEKIRLEGVDDLWYGEPNMKAHRGISPETFTLLVTHQPNFIDQIKKEAGINFVMAGHTHGGQVKMFNYLPVMPASISRWEYTAGLVETPQARMLVSSGFGNVAPYFRFFSPPKIHEIIFKSAPHVKMNTRQKLFKKAKKD